MPETCVGVLSCRNIAFSSIIGSTSLPAYTYMPANQILCEDAQLLKTSGAYETKDLNVFVLPLPF